MRRYFVFFILFVVFTQTAFRAVPPVTAPTVEITNRGPASIRYYPPQSVRPLELDFETNAQLRRIVFEHVVRDYALVRNANDFLTLFAVSHDFDRREVRKVFAKMKKRPAFSIEDEKLVARGGGKKIVLEWPDVTRSEFRLNGEKWLLNPTKPLMPQIAWLAQRLDRKTQSGAWNQLLLPNAEAMPLAIPGWVLVSLAFAAGKFTDLLSTTISSEAVPLLCQALDSKNFTSVLTICRDWKKKQIEAENAANPKFDSLVLEEGANNAGTKILSQWTIYARSCPTKIDDKQDRVFFARFRPNKFKDGKVVDDNGPWYFTKAVFSADGKPKSQAIASQEEFLDGDLDLAENAARLWMKMEFDKGGTTLTGIEIPQAEAKKKEGSDPLASPTVKVANGMQLTPDQAARWKRAWEFVVASNAAVTKCIIKKYEDDIKNKIDPNKKEEKPEGEKTTPKKSPAIAKR